MRASVLLIGIIILLIGIVLAAYSFGVVPMELPIPEAIGGIPTIGIGGILALVGILLTYKGATMY